MNQHVPKTARDIAMEYAQRGWNPVPVPFKSKVPSGTEWQKRVIREEDVPAFFNGQPQNIGVQMGKVSNGLTDVDLDCQEAVDLASWLLPKTNALFGRTSKPASHWLYRTRLGETRYGAEIQFRDPTRGASEAMLLELRIGGTDEKGETKGCQTVFPGSVHETGEPITWDDGGEPAEVNGEQLLHDARLLASCCLLARYWPGNGARHDAALTLGGFFARAGFKVPEIKHLVQAIARAAGDEEWKDRVTAAQDHANEFRAGKKARGLPALKKTFGEEVGKRIADWLDYKGQSEEDIPHIDDAPPMSETQSIPNLGEWDAGDDIDIPPPRQWLLGNQFCRKFLSGLLAPGSTGKTALRVLQCLSLATGRKLTGQHVFKRCRVLVVSLEDDKDELKRRIAAARIHYGIKPEELKGWLFPAAPKGFKLVEMKGGSRQIGLLEKMLRKAIEQRKPDLITLDPFIKLHALEENDNGAMDFVCDLLVQLAIEYDIAVDAPHHTKKGNIAAGDADAGRGASSARDAGRLVYTLTRMTEDEAKTFSIKPEDRNLYVRLDSGKVNIAKPSGEATWFKLIGVPLGNGTEEYPLGDEVQTVVPWHPPKTWEGVSSSQLNAALTDIDAGLPTGERYSNAGKADARAAWPVIQRHAPSKSERQCRDIINTWVKTRLLYSEAYDDPVARKTQKGLRVDNSKRPE
jgi:hypothetical protein